MTIPTLGSSFNSFLSEQNLSSESAEIFCSNIEKILRRSEVLNSVKSNCQLVVGQVQSGKTMSFTGLIAAARDNGFPLTILIAGTKKNLYGQSVKRLETDLKINGDGGANPWTLIERPNLNHLEEISDLLDDWESVETPIEFLKTGLLIALKSKAGIEKVAFLLEELGKRYDLSKFPILIIDDEADQASLNTAANSNLKSKNSHEKQSGVYAAITRMRAALPRHSFIMYTATPQAPLLLKLADHLSPSSVTLLTPGDSYLGGKDLFTGDMNFAMEIPEDELTAISEPVQTDGAPKSLRKALAYYLLALTVAQERSNPKPLSMMIHPASSVDLHGTYERWTKAVVESEWKISLADKQESSFYETLRKDFLPALQELKKTVVLPVKWQTYNSDEDLLENILFDATRHWIKRVQIKTINGVNPDIKSDEWPKHAGWILIGGNKLERGFTVENLAVTFMPRGPGVGNADVIQQRGRFFGYKKKYADLLRGWLSPDTIQNYKNYVEHEMEMHKQLSELDSTDASLKDWRRKFLLDKSMKICRTQVQGLPVAHEQLVSGFVLKQSQLFHDFLIGHEDFEFKLESLKSNLTRFELDLRRDRFNAFRKIDWHIGLELLADWPASPDEREQIDRLIYGLQASKDEDVSLEIRLVFMDLDAESKQITRKRGRAIGSLSESDKNSWRISNLHQGKNPKSGPIEYPGDPEIKFNDSVTLQVHLVRPEDADLDCPSVYALAVALPDSMSKGVVWQIQE